ncbi:MAG: DNA polymerase III subunit beta [Dehalococcoidia bacterium]|nr:DNA polymerase III subunit beta [Chloroflexi bacterium CFX7]NUQ55184.1 DNA polymerase III subunit beta [Dehalococcoidia bacterium]
MKVQVLQENLQRGLGIVGRAVATRTTLPITSNVLVATDRGRLKLAATDLDISISTWVGARIDEDGATTIPSRLITDFISSLPPATVSLEVPERGRQVKLECARNESTINTMDAEDFPRMPTIAEGVSIELDPKLLKRAIERVEFAAAADESRPVLTGVEVKTEGTRLTFAAADGFRLAVADITLPAPAAEAVAAIVPARALREVARLVGESSEPVTMRLNPARTQVMFEIGENEIHLVAQLIQGTFPNYAQIIPGEWTTRCVVDVDEFKREVRIAAIFARDGAGIVRLQIQPGAGMPGKLTITARAEEIGENQGEIDARVEGDAGRIAFNSRYLQDVLNVLSGEVALEMTTPSNQGVFRPVSEADNVHVVMPMFVQW